MYQKSGTKSSTLLTLFKIDFSQQCLMAKEVLSFSFGRHDKLCENLMVVSQVFSLLLKSIKRYRTQSG